MRARFDQCGKQTDRAALTTRGPVETDAEVPADTRRIDRWFMLDPTRGVIVIKKLHAVFKSLVE